MKLVWYYNNALGRPNKKKFIALEKSYVRLLNWCGYLPIFSWSNSKAPYILFHILVGTMGRLSYQLVFLGGIILHPTSSTENLLFFLEIVNLTRELSSQTSSVASRFWSAFSICVSHWLPSLLALSSSRLPFWLSYFGALLVSYDFIINWHAYACFRGDWRGVLNQISQ